MICWLVGIGAVSTPCEMRPDGQFDPAHIFFSKHYLTKAPLGPGLTKEQAMDPRILRPLCRRHHHEYDSKRIVLAREQLPESVIDFAHDYSLEHKLPT